MPVVHAPIASKRRLAIALSVGVAILIGCGGSPTSVPGQGAANLPPQTNPGVADKDKDKKAGDALVPRRTIRGTVLDSLTGEPVEKALVVVEGVQTTSLSTPIPPAPSPGKEELDEPSPPLGGGGGPAEWMLAQADNPRIPDAETTTAPVLPAPVASASANASATTSLNARPSASAAAQSSATASVEPAAAASGTPPTASGPAQPATTARVDSRGKFEFKDLPEGTYNLTVWAPGYQALSLIGTMPSEVDIPLRPLEPDLKKLHEMKGVVRLANNQPAAKVDVEVSSVAGKLAGGRELTDENGSFSMKGLPSGSYSAAAWTTNLEGEIVSFAMVKEVPVSQGRERRTVSPTLILRAVTAPLLFAGTVEGSAKETEVKAAIAAKKGIPGVRPTRVQAAIVVGDGEIPLASVPVAKDGYFRLRLPPLPEGATYHLTASGQSETGQTSHVHVHDLEAADPKVSLKLPEAPDSVTPADRSKHPRFTWEAHSTQVTAYRLAVEKTGPDGDTIWETWTSGTGASLPNVKDLYFLREGESYRYILSAVKLVDDKKFELTNLADRPWEFSGLTKPATFEVVRNRPQSGSRTLKDSGRAPKPLLKSPRPSPSAPLGSPSASPTSSAKPSPKSPRIKPMDSL
ncbi:MAG: hypothetical protein VKP62_08700 [Candidatus Sericytochromatia bacterium]|nr:hypothetical protein [Candidatus Sericytochromatia bacterium]